MKSKPKEIAESKTDLCVQRGGCIYSVAQTFRIRYSVGFGGFRLVKQLSKSK